jgi:SAM-dependent methyltransferase
MVYNPTSTCFIDNVEKVYEQCSRVLKKDGYLLTSVTNPILYIFDEKKVKKEKLRVKYTIPFSDLKSLSEKELKKRMKKYDTIEFSHTLHNLLGGLCRNGFSIISLYSDVSGCEILDSFVQDCYLAVRAKKNN